MLMKSKNDHFTGEMFGNRPGRPRKVNAMTGAQRVAKHRAAKKVISVTCNEKQSCGSCANSAVCSGFTAIGQLGLSWL
jgi:hypothetical protein